MSLGTPAISTNLSSPFAAASGQAQARFSNPFGLELNSSASPQAAAAPNNETPFLLAAPQTGVFPQGAITPENAENRILTFDIDEVCAARVEKSQIKDLEKKGYVVHKIGLDENGKEDEHPYFIERDHVKTLLEKLISQGFVLIAASRNTPHHMNTIIDTLGLGKYFFHRFNRWDITSKENQDFDKFPNHSNRVGFWEKLTDKLSRMTVGKVSEFFRWLKSKISKKAPYYPNTVVGTVNKYPPRWASRVLFDDKSENTSHAKRSGDWVHVQVKPFTAETATESRKLDAQGNPEWWKSILDTSAILNDPARGWKDLFKTTYSKDPKPVKVEVHPEFNTKFKQAFGFGF